MGSIKPYLFVIVGLILLILVVIPGTSSGAPYDSADHQYQLAEDAVKKGDYEQAYNLFINASSEYAAHGDEEKKKDSLRQAKRINWFFFEMSLNQTSADETIRAAHPEFTSEERKAFLEPGASIQFESDGKVYYYEGIVRNIRYHNATLSRDFTRTLGESPFFDQVSPYISAPQDEKNPLYHNHTFLATGLLSIARDLLPGNGTLQVWVPLPVSTDSQSDIQVTSVVPEKFVVSGPVTTGEIGEVYLEIPLEEVTDEHVNVSVTVSFTTSPRITKVDPDQVQTYDISGPLYQRYTKSQPNINITPEIITLAQKIVGDETDPYKKARLIYDYIIETLPYSNVPHSYITAMSIPESDFVHNTGFGDCGTQSAYFAALCRASGIPARAPGGYQITPGHEGPHFWAEFYLPENGWIPVDVTIAEAGDWAYNATPGQVKEFKDFYFGNMDPYRFTIQTDMDEPFSGGPDPDIIFTVAYQNPAVVCHSSDADVELIGMSSWSYAFEDEIPDKL